MSYSNARSDLDAALAGEYEIVRETPHSAGFSTFEARARKNGARVEVKAVPAGDLGGLPAISDAELARRRLQHPNILPVLKAGRYGDTFFWVSPSIDSLMLSARLSRGGRMELKDALTVLRDVSAALTHAHLHGVVHGGLSPDSILISGGSAVISDLGIAEVFSALRSQGAAGFSNSRLAGDRMRYASPEQAGGARSDARSDVYAWGVIGYELLGGRHPFAGRNTPRQMMAAHLDEEPVQLSTGPAGAPSGVTRLIMRCLSKDPSKRPESAREVLAVMTREMLVPPPAPAAGSGQKMMIGLMLAVMIVIVVIVVIAWLGFSQ